MDTQRGGVPCDAYLGEVLGDDCKGGFSVNGLLLLLTLTAGDVYDPHEPIELRREVDVPSGAQISSTFWLADKPARTRSFENGEVCCLWAPPGEYEVKALVTWVHWENMTTGQTEKNYSITIRGPPEPDKPDPVDPTDPDPVDPPQGSASQLILLEDPLRTTNDQAVVMLETTQELERSSKVEPFRLRTNARDERGDPSATVKAYSERMAEEGGSVPFFFLMASDGTILARGALPDSSEDLLKIVRQYP